MSLGLLTEPLARDIAALLTMRGESVAVSESSSGGLVSAALLAVPGASRYFLGGGVVYTAVARSELLGDEPSSGVRSSSPPYAEFCARAVSKRLGAVWGLAETGAAGPSGNRYGDAAGHTCIAVVGPVERALTVETGSADREANMWEFARAALALFHEALGQA